MQIDSLSSYLEEVLAIAHDFKNAADPSEVDGPWFRGAKDMNNELLPGLVWRNVQNELGIVTEFYDEVPSYFSGSGTYGTAAPSTPWEWYFLMQHYGLPTRLLDWTENALIGLFFALHNEGPAPCVWVLDPAQMNKRTVGLPCVISTGGELSKPWLPFPPKGPNVNNAEQRAIPESLDAAKPIAIYAPRNNARILAQQGAFTVHGTGRAPLALILGGFERSPLRRIAIATHKRMKLLDDLELCGVAERRIYPELERLAPYLKKRHGITP